MTGCFRGVRPARWPGRRALGPDRDAAVMHKHGPACGRRRALPWLVVVLLAIGRAQSGFTAGHPADDIPPITRIGDARSLPAAELARNPPVKLRAVVTRATPSSLFVQDDTAGMYVNIARALIRGVMDHDWPRPVVPLGSEVEIDGVADPGGFSPIILPRTFQVLSWHDACSSIIRPRGPRAAVSGEPHQGCISRRSS